MPRGALVGRLPLSDAASDLRTGRAGPQEGDPAQPDLATHAARPPRSWAPTARGTPCPEGASGARVPAPEMAVLPLDATSWHPPGRHLGAVGTGLTDVCSVSCSSTT